MTSSRPSSNRSAAVTALIVAATGFLSAATTYLITRSQHEPEDAPRHSAEPPPVPPLGRPDPTPTTDEGVIAARTLEARLNPLLAVMSARISVLETRVCLLEQELRDEAARRVQLAAGKRGADTRQAFERDSGAWATCPLELKDVQGRKSLREAMPASLR